MNGPLPYRPSTVHAELGEGFFDPVAPARFPRRIERFWNARWAARVGLGDLDADARQRHFAEFEPLPGSFPRPLALRYHGHQFRVYNPDIGDGRGFLFAQLSDDRGRLLDLATKGSGQTPYSRFGDGRLTLKGGVREVLATELLEALGVYTSKSFSLFETGEALSRNDEPSPTRSSVLVRLGHSHVRIGTFQRLAAEDRPAHIQRLVDHCLAHYMPDLDGAAPERVTAFFGRTVANVARMGAEWMVAGFVHGVLNTDNTVVTGESFDYGPWRFLPHYDPLFTAAYFDHVGLYAYGRQPSALQWNLARLAECLAPLALPEGLEAALARFDDAFTTALCRGLTRRLGVVPAGGEADTALARAVFTFLHRSQAPFERFFFDWFGGEAARRRALDGPSAAHYRSEAFAPVAAALATWATDPAIDLDHPYFAGPGPATLLIDEVEALWRPIAEADDWSAFDAKLRHIDQAREALGLNPSREG